MLAGLAVEADEDKRHFGASGPRICGKHTTFVLSLFIAMSNICSVCSVMSHGR